eukprot:jgi/Chlat1/4350/Chrsp29S04503
MDGWKLKSSSQLDRHEKEASSQADLPKVRKRKVSDGQPSPAAPIPQDYLTDKRGRTRAAGGLRLSRKRSCVESQQLEQCINILAETESQPTPAKTRSRLKHVLTESAPATSRLHTQNGHTDERNEFSATTKATSLEADAGAPGDLRAVSEGMQASTQALSKTPGPEREQVRFPYRDVLLITPAPQRVAGENDAQTLAKNSLSGDAAVKAASDKLKVVTASQLYAQKGGNGDFLPLLVHSKEELRSRQNNSTQPEGVQLERLPTLADPARQVLQIEDMQLAAECANASAPAPGSADSPPPQTHRISSPLSPRKISFPAGRELVAKPEKDAEQMEKAAQMQDCDSDAETTLDEGEHDRLENVDAAQSPLQLLLSRGSSANGLGHTPQVKPHESAALPASAEHSQATQAAVPTKADAAAGGGGSLSLSSRCIGMMLGDAVPPPPNDAVAFAPMRKTRRSLLGSAVSPGTYTAAAEQQSTSLKESSLIPRSESADHSSASLARNSAAITATVQYPAVVQRQSPDHKPASLGSSMKDNLQSSAVIRRAPEQAPGRSSDVFISPPPVLAHSSAAEKGNESPAVNRLAPATSPGRISAGFLSPPVPARHSSMVMLGPIHQQSPDRNTSLNTSLVTTSNQSPAIVPQLAQEESPARSSASVRRFAQQGQTRSPATVVKPTMLASVQTEVPKPVADVYELCQWGMPEEICEVYAEEGLKQLYAWQKECLNMEGVLQGRSLVYSAPTSGGKSLVAEVVMLRRLLDTDRKALVVLPFVALSQEKEDHLERLLQPVDRTVKGFYGSKGAPTIPKEVHVAVCTIEKANILVNKLMEEDRLGEIGIVVVDELHMLGDEDRGYLLELLLTKLLYATGRGAQSKPESQQGEGVQIVGMSATLPNLNDVADWLKAACFRTDMRPVPLYEYVTVGDKVYDKAQVLVRTLKPSPKFQEKDKDRLALLCAETVKEDYSVLVFCQSKDQCKSSALHVASLLEDPPLELAEQALSAIEELRRLPGGINEVLEKVLPKGVAYHNAGLTAEERELVEKGFRKGVVRVLMATSTLAAGVNLPARRVIFRTPKIGNQFLDGIRYRQMAGRAGRAGIDTLGESIVIVTPGQSNLAPCEPLASCLSETRRGMKRALLEVVVGGVVQTTNDVQRYVHCTLLKATLPTAQVVSSAQASLQWLVHHGFIKWNEEKHLYYKTKLGEAAYTSLLPPEEALLLYDELQKARRNFIMNVDLHLMYIVTPIYTELGHLDWGKYFQIFSTLPTDELRVAEVVGVHGGDIQLFWLRPHNQNENAELRRMCHRFYAALMLSKLVQEVPIDDVAQTFSMHKGPLEQLQNSAGRFASAVSKFCECVGWDDLAVITARFASRVERGVRNEVLELTDIPHIKSFRARQLYKEGYRTVAAVAEATPEAIAEAFLKLGGDYPGKRRADFRAAHHVVEGARKLMLERADEAAAQAKETYEKLGLRAPVSSATPPKKTKEKAGKKQGRQKHDTAIAAPPVASNVIQSGTAQTPSNLIPAFRHATMQPSRPLLDKGSKPPASTSVEHSEDNEDEEAILAEREIRAIEASTSHAKASAGQGSLAAMSPVKLASVPIGHHPPDAVEQLSSKTMLPAKGAFCIDDLPGGVNLEEFCQEWKKAKTFAFAVHHSRLKCRDGRSDVEGLAVCWDEQASFYIPLFPLGMKADGNVDFLVLDRWRRIKDVFEHKGMVKVTHNLKDQQKALFHGTARDSAGNGGPLLPAIVVAEDSVDVDVSAWMLDPDAYLDRKVLYTIHTLFQQFVSEGRQFPAPPSDWSSSTMQARVNVDGCMRKASQSLALHKNLLPRIVGDGQLLAFKEEMKMPRVLAVMELAGVRFSKGVGTDIKRMMRSRLKDLESKFYEGVGTKMYKLSSPADVSKALFQYLKVQPPADAKLRKDKLYSTDAKTLALVDHPVARIVTEWRSLSKHMESWQNYAGACGAVRADRVCGTYLQTGSPTGRLAMDEPNLQCVPKLNQFAQSTPSTLGSDHDITQESQKIIVNMRNAFVAEEGFVLLSADYAQIEVRIMAHFSGDEVLREFLRDNTNDFFRMMAAKWLKKASEEINAVDRENVKRMVYGFLYGMGANSLSKQIGCSPDEARQYMEDFRVAFPKLDAWRQQVFNECKRDGFILTLLGRKRIMHDIHSTLRDKRASAERTALNSICQGSAADVVKAAMVHIDSWVRRHEAKYATDSEEGALDGASCFCRLLLQIHDELLFEIRRDVVDEVAPILKGFMEQAFNNLHVPMRVRLVVGPSWGSMELLELHTPNSSAPSTIGTSTAGTNTVT